MAKLALPRQMFRHLLLIIAHETSIQKNRGLRSLNEPAQEKNEFRVN